MCWHGGSRLASQNTRGSISLVDAAWENPATFMMAFPKKPNDDARFYLSNRNENTTQATTLNLSAVAIDLTFINSKRRNYSTVVKLILRLMKFPSFADKAMSCICE